PGARSSGRAPNAVAYACNMEEGPGMSRAFFFQVRALWIRSADDARPRRSAPAERGLPTPVTDQQPAEQHPAQVSEVGHARLPTGEPEQQLGKAVDDHQRARLHRDRWDQ